MRNLLLLLVPVAAIAAGVVIARRRAGALTPTAWVALAGVGALLLLVAVVAQAFGFAVIGFVLLAAGVTGALSKRGRVSST